MLGHNDKGAVAVMQIELLGLGPVDAL